MDNFEHYKNIIPVSKNLLDQIDKCFDDFSHELGAAIGIKDNIVSLLYPLENENTNHGAFSPSLSSLNKASDYFYESGGEFIGIIHSHPSSFDKGGSNYPSKSDKEFYISFMEINPHFKKLIFPIISIKNHKKEIAWYLLENKIFYSLDIQIV